MAEPQSDEHLRLGRAVRVLRARRAFSQEELGYRAGLHRNYVGAIERGETNPTFTLLLRLCKGLDFRLSLLVEEFERESRERRAER